MRVRTQSVVEDARWPRRRISPMIAWSDVQGWQLQHVDVLAGLPILTQIRGILLFTIRIMGDLLVD